MADDDYRIPSELVNVEPSFAEALGLTVDEVKGLSLRDLSNRAFDRGLDLIVSNRRALSGQGRLTLSGPAPSASLRHGE